MEITTKRYAVLLADSAFLHQVRDAIERGTSDAETITAIWAILKDADAIRDSLK